MPLLSCVRHLEYAEAAITTSAKDVFRSTRTEFGCVPESGRYIETAVELRVPVRSRQRLKLKASR